MCRHDAMENTTIRILIKRWPLDWKADRIDGRRCVRMVTVGPVTSPFISAVFVCDWCTAGLKRTY